MQKKKYKNIIIRKQQVKDAKDFFRILTNPSFIFFPLNVKSIEEEKTFLRKSIRSWKEKQDYNFSIIHNNSVVGAIGIMNSNDRSHIVEIGYFIDNLFWGRGIASQAVKLAEEFTAKELSYVKRIVIIMAKQNIGSEKVAINCGYKREGLMKSYMKIEDNWHDAYMYAKVLD